MILGFCQWMLLTVQAQISLELEWKERRYLPKEDFEVKVRLVNFSGQNLEIGNIHNWLKFEIETKDGHFIKPLKNLPTQGSSVVLSNSKEAMIPINLTEHFDIVRQGKYLIQAAASFTNQNLYAASKMKKFTIAAGVSLWSQVAGVPMGQGLPPAMVKYDLITARDTARNNLYIQISHVESKRILRAFPIHQIISFADPQAVVDQQGRLNVLCQVGAREFRYNQINLTGDIVKRQTHVFSDSRPRLRLSEKGEVVVLGGSRKLSPDDVPSSVKKARIETENILAK
jgi:hypothetical protein